MSEELLPCPLCRNEVKHESTITEEVIRCTNCFAGMSYDGSFEATKAMWNTRHLPLEVEAVLEAARNWYDADQTSMGERRQAEEDLEKAVKDFKALDERRK